MSKELQTSIRAYKADNIQIKGFLRGTKHENASN